MKPHWRHLIDDDNGTRLPSEAAKIIFVQYKQTVEPQNGKTVPDYNIKTSEGRLHRGRRTMID